MNTKDFSLAYVLFAVTACRRYRYALAAALPQEVRAKHIDVRRNSLAHVEVENTIGFRSIRITSQDDDPGEEPIGMTMSPDFSPQFHKRLSYNDGRWIWVATPHPETLMPIKMRLYQAWQREEYARLRLAGADVMAIAISI